jgi:hypothetical protein
MKYRRKAETIEAVKFDGEEALPDWAAGPFMYSDGQRVFVTPGHHITRVTPGDYIVRTEYGDIYPIKADVFEKMYEAVE